MLPRFDHSIVARLVVPCALCIFFLNEAPVSGQSASPHYRLIGLRDAALAAVEQRSDVCPARRAGPKKESGDRGGPVSAEPKASTGVSEASADPAVTNPTEKE